jgi:hypothetical protein
VEVTLTGIEGEKNLDSSLSWLPVGLLGIANALLFKKTGRLEAANLPVQSAAPSTPSKS